MVAGTIDDAVR